MANNYTIQMAHSLLKWRPVFADQRFWTEAEAKATAKTLFDDWDFTAVCILKNGEPVAYSDGSTDWMTPAEWKDVLA